MGSLNLKGILALLCIFSDRRLLFCYSRLAGRLERRWLLEEGWVLPNGGKDERLMLAYGYGFDISREPATEYRVLGPTISGCSWLQLSIESTHFDDKKQLVNTLAAEKF
ncbi:hypothetical protein Tco_0591559 [Tanacetum coccineum]